MKSPITSRSGTIINSEWEAVPFYRYTNQNFQTAGFAGTDVNMPTGAGQMQFHNVGIAIFPSPKVVLKATYQKVIKQGSGGGECRFRSRRRRLLLLTALTTSCAAARRPLEKRQ